MYKATQDFKSYKHGTFKKGEEVPFNKQWLEAGLIEDKPDTPKKETKPKKQKAKETK